MSDDVIEFKAESSVIDVVSYSVKDHVLGVRFHNSRVYAYTDVPVDLVTQMRDAPSVGSFFVYNIRDKFHYDRIC